MTDEEFESRAREMRARTDALWKRDGEAPLPGSAFAPTNANKTFQNSPELGAKPLQTVGAKSIAELKASVRDNLWKGDAHPDLVAARKALADAEARGDALLLGEESPSREDGIPDHVRALCPSDRVPVRRSDGGYDFLLRGDTRSDARGSRVRRDG